jgi:hypothetical protein
VFTARYEINLSLLSKLNSETSRLCQTHVVSRQPVTAEARVGSQVNPRYMWWTKWPSVRFPPATSVFPCHYHSTSAP